MALSIFIDCFIWSFKVKCYKIKMEKWERRVRGGGYEYDGRDVTRKFEYNSKIILK